MPVFELVNERAVLDVEEVEGAEDARDAPGTVLVVKGLVGRQHHGRVVDAQHQAEVVLEFLLPGIPGLTEVRFDLVLDRIGATEAGSRGLLCSGCNCQQQKSRGKNCRFGQNCHFRAVKNRRMRSIWPPWRRDLTILS